MKKILSIALILGATALMACPMKEGGMMMKKCECDTSKLPKPFEKLGLSDDQKAQIQKIREEGKAFHNQQHDKMMAVLTPEQLKTFEANTPKMCPKGDMKGMKGDMKGMKMGDDKMGGMGCKECDKK
jgi:Spy/CpxP family protein refolding chaperone